MLHGLDRFGADVDAHRDAQFGDHPAQQRAAGLVDLLVHQSRRPLDDVGAQPEPAQRVGGFQAEQAAADHDTDRRVARGEGAKGVVADRVEVVKGAVDVAGRQVVARHRRHKSTRTGGQHQSVVIEPFAVAGQHRPTGRVDLGHPAAQPQRDPVVAAVVVARQGQLAAVPVVGVAGEPDSVTGGVGLLGQHRHPPRALGIARPQRFDEPVSDHAVADDHDAP